MSDEKKGKKQQVVKDSVPLISPPDFKQWFTELYDVLKIPDEDLLSYYEIFKYKGFSRDEVLKQLFDKGLDKSTYIQLILLCAIQGPIRASRTKLLNGKTPMDLGIPASGQKGTTNLSCQRITAATADLAAYLLKRLKVPKRLDISCPGWLQFPAAGSIKMPDDIRQQHIEFAKKFSLLIGGEFNESIYSTMIATAYCDDKLDLF
jgi:hypothetical protein